MFIYVLPYQLTQKYACLGQVKAVITYLYLSALMASSLAELGASNTLATDFKTGFRVDNNICYTFHSLSLLFSSRQCFCTYWLVSAG